MSGEFTFKNYKSYEEAQKVWNSEVQDLKGDFVIYYDEPKEEKEELIGIESLETKEIDLRKKVMAKSNVVTGVEIDDEVIIDPRIFMGSSLPTIIGDCLFWITPSKSVVAIMKRK